MEVKKQPVPAVPKPSSAKAVDAASTSFNGTSARPSYSSKLGASIKAKSSQPVADSSGASSPSSRQSPAPQQQPKAWTTARNPITGRSPNSQQVISNNTANNQSATSSLGEGQKVRITLATGAEYEGVYASNPSDPATFTLNMAQKKPAGDITNGTGKRDQNNMAFQRKDVVNARSLSGNPNQKNQNGNRSSFRTDTAISNTARGGAGRQLVAWQPDSDVPAPDSLEGGLGKASRSNQPWDQFAANEQKFGIKSDYDEHYYTTAIDKNHPEFKSRMAMADKKAREIEGSSTSNTHIAEERVMDYAGGGEDQDEEDKYSGVRRGQELRPSGRENMYMPPARRPPMASSSVAGAPVDPAIISAQVKGSQPKKQSTPKPDDSKNSGATSGKAAAEASNASTKLPELKKDAKSEQKTSANKAAALDIKAAEAKSGDKADASASSKTAPASKDVKTGKDATANVEADVLQHFKSFANQQRVQEQVRRTNKIKQDTQIKLQELKKFADSFKLSTPVPNDLISIIAKDPAKQKKIQEKAIQNANEMKQKGDSTKVKETAPPKEGPTKPMPEKPATNANVDGAGNRSQSQRGAPQHTPSPSGTAGRHPGNNVRQPYTQGGGYQQNMRNNNHAAIRSGSGSANTGNLHERISHNRQQQQQQPRVPQHQVYNHDMRLPPTGPANGVGRFPPMHPQHAVARLNPNSHEFRPGTYGNSLSQPTGPSTGSSPRSGVGMVADAQAAPAPTGGSIIRRKTKAVDAKQCNILAHLKTIEPPAGRHWDENGGFRPSYDTPAAWRQANPDGSEEKDATMNMNYKEYFDKMMFAGAAMATPSTQFAHPMANGPYNQMGPQMQQAHAMPRQSPHMPQMAMHPGPHGPVPHVAYNPAEDHRMIPSNSQQSYPSPRMSSAAFPPNMPAGVQMPYGQPGMPQYQPGTPYRNFSHMQQGSGPMMPMMAPHQQQFMAAPMPGTGQMPMYPGGPQQFMPAPGAVPQHMPGVNGYPSPGRAAAAPMMVQQGSQQGQPMYGVSPGPQYQQPFGPGQHPVHMPMRNYSNQGQQHFGTSPQQMHQFQHGGRNGGNNHGNHHGNKNFQGHNQHQGQGPPAPQARAADGTEEAK